MEGTAELNQPTSFKNGLTSEWKLGNVLHGGGRGRASACTANRKSMDSFEINKD